MRGTVQETAAADNARSINAKAGKKKGKTKGKKSAGKHKRTGRKRPTDIDEEVAADAHVCDACGSDHLSKVLDEYERVITEVEQVKAKITRIVVKRRYCTSCKKLVSGKTDLALPNSRFGINFMMMVTVLKLHGMLDLRIHEIVAMIYAISITESAINRMVLRMARELGRCTNRSEKRYTCFQHATGMRVPGALMVQIIDCGWL